MTDGEVVLHRIVRIEVSERRRDLACHLPAWTETPRQTQTTSHANHVGVERNDERSRRHTRPDAKIERVLAHHPTEEQIEALARASRFRTRKEVRDARPLGTPAVCRLQVERHRAS